MVQTNAPKMEAQKGKEKRCALAGMPTLWTGPELDGVCMFMRSVYLVCVCVYPLSSHLFKHRSQTTNITTRMRRMRIIMIHHDHNANESHGMIMTND